MGIKIITSILLLCFFLAIAESKCERACTFSVLMQNDCKYDCTYSCDTSANLLSYRFLTSLNDQGFKCSRFNARSITCPLTKEFGSCWNHSWTCGDDCNNSTSTSSVDENNNDTGTSSTILGLNEFADLTNQEFKSLLNLTPKPRDTTKLLQSKTHRSASNSNILSKSLSGGASEFDWISSGCVSPVRNQGSCGSCYAFVAVDSLEFYYCQAKNKTRVNLSQQNLVDCTFSYGNRGCIGGWYDTCYDYIIKNNGIDTAESYPYNVKVGECQFKEENVGATMTSYNIIKEGDENAIAEVVQNVGIVNFAFYSSEKSFQFYKGGIYNDKNCRKDNPDHGATIIGLGVDYQGNEYWYCKNSWGTTWGIQGFFKLMRGVNQCGVGNYGSYPVV
eukprot:gene8356-10263_t